VRAPGASGPRAIGAARVETKNATLLTVRAREMDRAARMHAAHSVEKGVSPRLGRRAHWPPHPATLPRTPSAHDAARSSRVSLLLVEGSGFRTASPSLQLLGAQMG